MEIELGREDVSAPVEGSGIDPYSFYVVRVPENVFSTDPEETLRPEFEAVFRMYGEDVKFTYLRSFGRVRVSYPSSEQASMAQENLNHREFRGSNLKVCSIKPFTLGSQTLSLPKLTKQFLISPPASPPVGWEPSDEQAPCLDFSLVTALASLQLPGDSQELHEGTATTPSIVVVSPEDLEMDITPSILRERDSEPPSVSLSSLPPELRHTARPPGTHQ